jgi:hypothetical protein
MLFMNLLRMFEFSPAFQVPTDLVASIRKAMVSVSESLLQHFKSEQMCLVRFVKLFLPNPCIAKGQVDNTSTSI